MFSPKLENKFTSKSKGLKLHLIAGSLKETFHYTTENDVWFAFKFQFQKKYIKLSITGDKSH